MLRHTRFSGFIAAACLFVAAPLLATDLKRVNLETVNSASPFSTTKSGAETGDAERVLLQFWASWCHSCGSIMWDLDELVARKSNVRYMAVSVDEERSAAQAYLEKHPLYDRHSERYFFDDGGRLASALDVDTVPNIFVLDGDGNILEHRTGHLNSSDLQALSVALNID